MFSKWKKYSTFFSLLSEFWNITPRDIAKKHVGSFGYREILPISTLYARGVIFFFFTPLSLVSHEREIFSYAHSRTIVIYLIITIHLSFLLRIAKNNGLIDNVYESASSFASIRGILQIIHPLRVHKIKKKKWRHISVINLFSFFSPHNTRKNFGTQENGINCDTVLNANQFFLWKFNMGKNRRKV